MKILTLSAFVLTGLILLAPGCKKDDNSSATAISIQGNDTVMTARMNGKKWEAAIHHNNLLIVQNSGKVMSLQGISSDGKQITLTLRNEQFATEAMPLITYLPGPGPVNDQCRYEDKGTNYITTNSSVTLTAHNTKTKKVSGTFSFNCYRELHEEDTVNVTRGSFTNVSYSVQRF